MRIDAHIGNPIIYTQQDYYELENLLHEVEPDCHSVQLRQERLNIENLSRRTFCYSRNPTIQWVADRLVTWSKTGYKCS